MRPSLLCLLALTGCCLVQSARAAPAQAAAAAAAAHPQEAAFFNSCPRGADWIRYRDSCFKFYEHDEYWYVAEQQCRQHGGHLVSIDDKAKNSFVAKLTYCRSSWIGRYAVNVDKLRDPTNYRWTDGTTSSYHSHNFSTIQSIHEPLISVSNQQWYNRVYHSRDQFVCEVRVAGGGGGGSGNKCGSGLWKYLDGQCYHISPYPLAYHEGMFYCAGRGANLTSIYNVTELRALSLLDLTSDGCPPQVWIGLMKINPCRIDIFTQQPICYMWFDRVEKHYSGFPAWHPGHPDQGEVVNCVLLEDRQIKTVECYRRHRVVCKKQAN